VSHETDTLEFFKFGYGDWSLATYFHLKAKGKIWLKPAVRLRCWFSGKIPQIEGRGQDVSVFEPSLYLKLVWENC
jgi:hypothetical protein